MAKENLFAAMEKSGIVKHGHLKLTSGRHSDVYFNKDGLHQLPWLRKNLIEQWKQILLDAFPVLKNSNSMYLTGPATAGSLWTTLLSHELEVPMVYCEKRSNSMVFGRGFVKMLTGNPVIIIEDVITTGASVLKTLRAVESKTIKGVVVGISCIWNRPMFSNIAGRSIYPIFEGGAKSWGECCPLCAAGVPIQNPKED
jgi:orotate phosphoribosyltransferase